MPAAYSIDLREKVIAAIDRGEKKSQVSRMFNISRDTIDRWLNRRDSQEIYKPYKAIKVGIVTGSRIGRSFAVLPNDTATRLKPKWRNCGKGR
jgi:transposase